MSDTTRRRRNRMFAYSDVNNAAEEFMEAIAEHADPMWDQEDIATLTAELTEKALAILSNPKETW